jgi:CDGSH-type Zn-finger protein
MENRPEKKTPRIITQQPGQVAWCRCGHSKNHPYCDGSHLATIHTPLVETLTEAKTVAICACGQSKSKPFCDGSHRSL